MGRRTELVLENVRLEKLIHGGQAISESPDGRKLLVLGGLPGELVHVRVIKKKKSFLEGIVTEVVEASPDRITPVEPDSYLSTSPWQIMTFNVENRAKESILEESFKREGIEGVAFHPFVSGKEEYGYRNKQEFGFWGDEAGVHIAHFVRGTHTKQKVQGSALAKGSINKAARAVRDELNRLDVWGGKLKTLVLRCSQANEVVGALFIKEKLDLKDLKLPKELKGLDIYYSEPKSPASLPTKKLYSLGDIKLMDTIAGTNIIYDVLSFFQVNLPVFEIVLKKMEQIVSDSPAIDMYSGVGTIGVSLKGVKVLVELEASNIVMAKENVKGREVEVIHASSETALSNIDSKHVLIVDPPRAGLHRRVIGRILEAKPPLVVYLSCNPSTQARDVALLAKAYSVSYAGGYNFFPRTPHIESLVVLKLV